MLCFDNQAPDSHNVVSVSTASIVSNLKEGKLGFESGQFYDMSSLLKIRVGW